MRSCTLSVAKDLFSRTLEYVQKGKCARIKGIPTMQARRSGKPKESATETGEKWAFITALRPTYQKGACW